MSQPPPDSHSDSPPEKEHWFASLLKWTFFIVIGGVVLGTLVIAGTCALMSMH